MSLSFSHENVFYRKRAADAFSAIYGNNKETRLLRWVHTCNVTAYRNAVRLQVTDTIRSYEMNFHPVPNGVTVSCERYTAGFSVCYGSPGDVFATSSGFIHLYRLRFKEKEKRAAVVTCHVVRPAGAAFEGGKWGDRPGPRS